jgi:hypothetical protein
MEVIINIEEYISENGLTETVSGIRLSSGLVNFQASWSKFKNALVTHVDYGHGTIQNIELRLENLFDGPLISIIFGGSAEAKIFNQRSFYNGSFPFVQCSLDALTILELNIKKEEEAELKSAKIDRDYQESCRKEPEKHLAKINNKNPWNERLFNSAASNRSAWIEANNLDRDYQRRRSEPQHSTTSNLKVRDHYSRSSADDYEEYSHILHEAANSIPKSQLKNDASKQKYYPEFSKAIEKYNIEHLVHFTHIDNLESILNLGLLSRKELHARGEDFRIMDNQRNDGILEAYCLSVSFPNYQLFYKARHKLDKSEPYDWVVIEINPKVLLYNKIAFARYNAASSTQKKIPVADLVNVQSFENLFTAEPNKPSRNEIKLPDNYTTNPQSELLCFDNIATEFIQSVNFLNDRAYVKSKADELKALNPYIDFKVNKFYFDARCDYKHWESKQSGN